MNFALFLLLWSALNCFSVEAALQSALKERIREGMQDAAKEQPDNDDTPHVHGNLTPHTQHQFTTPVCSVEVMHTVREAGSCDKGPGIKFGAPVTSSSSLADMQEDIALRISAGHSQRDAGMYAAATSHYSRAQELAKELKDKRQQVEALQHLGAVRLLEGRLTDAQSEFEHALAVAGTRLEAEDSQRADVLHALGNVHREMGNTDKALELYTEARQFQDLLPRVSIDMAEAYSRLGQFETGSKYLEEALAELDEDSVDVAHAHSLDCSIRLSRGDAASSIKRCQQALHIQAKALRPGHPDIVQTTLHLARAQRDLGSLEEALQTLEALEQTLRTRMAEELSLSRVLTQKADLLREMGRLPDAEEAMTQALAFKAEAAPEVAAALNIYGGILQDQGKFEEAKAQFQHALTMNLESVGQWHPETAAIHNSLGTLFQDLGDLIAARDHFNICLEIQQKTLGAGSPEVASTYNNLATILFQTGHPKEAAELLQETLSLLDAAQVPEGSPDRMLYAENLKSVLSS